MSHAIRCGSCKGTHATAREVKDCYYAADDTAGEIYAEAVMSWVCSGGNAADAHRYASVIAAGEVWDGGIDHIEFSGQLCEHGMALELCEGPQHYPLDDYRD